MATLHPDDYNGYYMSDTASVPSAALESLPSSSQQPSISYGGTTSDTSFREPDPFPSQDFPSHATTACAEDLLFFGDFTSNEPFNLPEGDILPKSPNENAASQLKTEQTRPERRNGVVGVPTINTHRGTAGSKSLVEARDDIMDFINVHLNKQECTSAHILRTKKAIDVLEELLKNYPSPGTESIVNDGGCLICGVTSPRFMNKGVLTRHVKDQHFPQFKHSCPKDGCTVTQHRKDKMKAHIRAHPGINPESFDTSEFPCPIQCPCCRLLTNGWEEFYTCIISHHKIGAPQSERAVSRNGSADHGQAPQMVFPENVLLPPPWLETNFVHRE
ncbi:hypothetical protein N7533_000863 [Penicillium manginii]|uniref:uncharacterized protein n=1 Tax=Penicillium manginii TaxID=203109 RepID=UPI0025474E84|nr:uncharacterized protein N7533_000863 [Penicillium manginii]KAJ5768280.1 hypothetical protein N7533_000863 [Penicillium manginii]